HLQPERIDSLILASSYVAADDHIARITQHWRELAQSRGMEALFDECIEWLFSDEYTRQRSEVNQLKTFYRLTLQEVRAFVAQSLAGVEHDAAAWISGLTTPALILCGTADRLVDPSHSDRLSR